MSDWPEMILTFVLVLAASQLTGKYSPEMLDKFVLCQIPVLHRRRRLAASDD